MVAQVGYSMAEWSRGRVAPCAIYIMHVETRSTGFLAEPQNQGRRFVSGLTSKPLGRFYPVWPQNRWWRFLQFSLKIGSDNLLVEPQNQGGGGLSGLGLKTGSYSLVIWASKSPRRFLGLCLKTNQASVCRLRHKTDGRMRQRGTHIEI
jgi:hypothetical protein